VELVLPRYILNRSHFLKLKILPRLIWATALFFLASTTYANDPLMVMSRTLSSPAASQRPLQACDSANPAIQKWSLAQVVERTLCANPETRAAWAAARIRAAELGQALGAYLPELNLGAGLSRTGDDVLPNDHWAWQTGLSANYLLYDFGGRDANRQQAEALLAAANLGHETVVRDLFREAVSGYYRLVIARGAVAAARESEAAALETVKASEARVKAGAAVPADRLQAQTAYSQRRLERIRSEGEAATLQGELASLMALPADTPLELSEPGELLSGLLLENSMEATGRLIEIAKQRRPELAAAESRLAANRAAVRAAKAAGKPVLTAQADTRYVDSGPADGWDSSIGINVSVPLFTGYKTTYRVRAAQEQVKQAEAERDRVENVVALDVWRGWQALKTGGEAYVQALDLLESAQAAERLTRGRYQAGLGSVLDVLNAQANTAFARQTQLQTRYNLDIARADLARAVGDLVWGVLDSRKIALDDTLKP
jgi:outer membrane protein TolC